MKKVLVFRNNYTRFVVILLFLCCSQSQSNKNNNREQQTKTTAVWRNQKNQSGSDRGKRPTA